jgi:glutamate-1-semialdehyde 2,1-aminomutase
MFSIFFTDRDVRNYDDAKTQDTDAFRVFFHAMLAAGVYLPPSAYESWFVSTAIDDDALAHIETALTGAAQAAAAANSRGAA